MPQNPRNRQEFLRMQEQAMAAAREMQRRATLPVPPAAPVAVRPPVPEQKRKRARVAWGTPQQPPPPEPSGFVQPLHHHRPSQQARQTASYGRIRPQANRQPPQNGWQAPPRQHTQRFEPPRGAKQNRQGQHCRPTQQSPPPKNRAYQETPPSPPATAMPPLSELFSMLGGFENMSGRGAPKPPETAFESAPPGDDSLDSILMMVLLLLLKKENANQGLMMALMYIMM